MTSNPYDDSYREARGSVRHAELMGEGLPAEIDPFSFVPMAGMWLLHEALALRPGQTLVDLGCGRGGPGLWLADQAGAALIGIDGSEVAVADARERVKLFPRVASARYEVADVRDTGLESGVADAVVLVDVFQLVEDRPAVAREIARVLKPGGRVALTAWEATDPAPPRYPRDVRAELAEVGLRVESVTEHPDWLERQNVIFKRAIEIDDGTDPAITGMAQEGRTNREWRQYTRRVAVTATKL